LKPAPAALATIITLLAGNASAQVCNVPTDLGPEARTAKCLLNIDGRLIIDQRCNFSVSRDGHLTIIDAGKHYAEVRVVTGGGAALGWWNRGSGRSDHLVSFGPVEVFDRAGSDCYRNRRFEFCTSEYVTCRCHEGETERCLPASE
jgi:hypothetical protein